MSGEIAALFVRLGLDASEFTAGIDKSKEATEGFSKSTVSAGTIVKGASVVIGAGLAVATKGAVEAERAQGDFMAATGASRDEAKAFVSGMDGLAGSAGTVGKSFQDIAAAGTMVQQQFGTAGQATTDLTRTVLEFSKVTRQDATGAAADLEDTLSAYGLSASDAAGFTDELIASSQKYGTQVGPDQLAVLRNISPALQDMGGNLDDGVGLLNAFESAGLDASTAQRGFNTALTKIPPGSNFDDVIASLGAIEDPADRAAAAVKIFGSMAGPKLAAVIKPGMTSLDDFTVSAQDAAGKTGKAADDMLTTTDRLKGFGEKLMAGARELGQKFGPALTGAASAATLAAPLLRQFPKLGKMIAGPLATTVGKAFSGIGSKIVLSASTFAKPLTTAVSTAFTGIAAKLATNAGVMKGMDKLGGLMGSRLGTAMKGVAVLALAAIAVEEWGKLQQQIQENKDKALEVSRKAPDFLAGLPSKEEVQAKIDALKALPDSLDPIKRALFETGGLGGLLGADPKAVWQKSIDDLQGYLDNSAAPQIAASVQGVGAAVQDTAATVFPKAWAEVSQLNGDGVTRTATEVAASIDKLRETIQTKMSTVQDAFDLGVDTKKKKNISGTARLKQMADDIDTITKRLHESVAANDPVNVAYWESALITAQGKYATASDNIAVSADQVAADVKAAGGSMDTSWQGIGQDAKHGANKVNTAADSVNFHPAANSVSNAADDMHDSFMYVGTSAGKVAPAIAGKVPAVHNAAVAVANAAANPLEAVNLYNSGAHMVDMWARGMRSSIPAVQGVINKLSHIPPSKLGFSEPPATGPLHSIRSWGPHMIDAWVDPMLKHGTPKVGSAARTLAASLAKGMAFDAPSATLPNVAQPGGHRRHRWDTPRNPEIVNERSSSGEAIHFHIGTLVASDGGIDELAARMNKRLRNKTRGAKRLVGAF